MDDNPLSSFTSDRGDGGGPTEFTSRGWDVGEILAEAWEIVKAQYATLFIGGIVYFAIVGTVNFIGQFGVGILQGILGAASNQGGGGEDAAAVVGVGIALLSCCSSVVNVAVQSFMNVGLSRYLLAVARQEEAPVGLLFSGSDRVLTLFLVNLLIGFAVIFGFILLIVPGIILALGLSMAQYLAADTKIGVVECLQASWSLTDGHKLNLFLLGLAVAGLMIVGIIPCGLGLFAVGPLAAMTYPLVYIRLTGRTSSGMGDPVVA